MSDTPEQIVSNAIPNYFPIDRRTRAGLAEDVVAALRDAGLLAEHQYRCVAIHRVHSASYRETVFITNNTDNPQLEPGDYDLYVKEASDE